jgi:signal transduction histidine kinase
MDMTHLQDTLPLLFLVAGFSLLGAAWYLARLSSQSRRALAALLQSITPQLEPLQLPAAAWPALSQGGIAQLSCTGKWFGQQINLVFGQTAAKKPHILNFLIEVEDDICLEFHLCTKLAKGEALLFAEHLCDVFELQMKAAVQVKVSALAAAMAEQARLTLYLQHDLRNLAQWVTWIADDFPHNQSDSLLLSAAKRVAVSVPHAAARAERILASTRRINPAQLHPQMVELARIFFQAAEMAGIAVEVSGDARIYLRLDLLERALDNMFTNVAPLLRTQPDRSLPVTITQEQQHVYARIMMPQLGDTPMDHPEKLFEPFSSGRVGGLGLGLYQARKSLRETGGDLSAESRAQGIEYTLTLPVASEYAQ